MSGSPNPETVRLALRRFIYGKKAGRRKPFTHAHARRQGRGECLPVRYGKPSG